MPLVGSGQISLGAIATEFGGDAPHALSEYYGKGNCPASGEIQLAADFYGTANTYDCQYLLVAGGGGASGPDSSSNGAGSGGAGGYRALTATLTPGSSGLTVTVGGGGPGGGDSWGYQPWNTPGQRFSSNGGNSSFNSTSASGGGANGLLTHGASGGSGGGGGYQGGGGSGLTRFDPHAVMAQLSANNTHRFGKGKGATGMFNQKSDFSGGGKLSM